MPQNPNRIGALWKPSTEKDTAPLGKGNIEIAGRKLDIVVWRNKWKKEGERTPDFYIELDTPREDRPRSAPERADAPAQTTRATPEAEFPDDIPF